MKNEKMETSGRWKKEMKKFFHNLFDIRWDTMSNEELQEMMEENTIIHGPNMWILMLAILIASIGLNVNSTAVIIGAMLISPLMSGILTMGYSLATRDLTMLRRAFTRFGTQVIISLITSTVYFMISPLDSPTSEIIARTNPTLWDVLIALFGGIAGMIGNTRQKKGNVIPGVAIATALMPPLCTAGYGIATAQLSFFLGALYLFTINTLFIMLSAAFVTKLLKVPAHDIVDKQKQKRINRFITLITVITIIPSILFGALTVYDSVVEHEIANYLANEFLFPDAQVVQSNTDYVNHIISVSLVGAPVSDEVIKRLEGEMRNYNLDGYSLQVTQNKTIEGENVDKVTIALQENTIQELQEQISRQQELIEEQQEKTDCRKLAQDAAAIFVKLKDCDCGLMSGADGEYILLRATAESALTSEEEQVLKNWLVTESGTKDVRFLITPQGN